MIDPPAIRYELSEKQQAISAGGIGVVLEAIKTLGVREAINEGSTTNDVRGANYPMSLNLASWSA